MKELNLVEHAADILTAEAQNTILEEARQGAYSWKSSITLKDDQNATLNTVRPNGSTQTFNVNAVDTSHVGPLALGLSLEEKWTTADGRPVGTYKYAQAGSPIDVAENFVEHLMGFNTPSDMATMSQRINPNGTITADSVGVCQLSVEQDKTTETCQNFITTADGKTYQQSQVRLFDAQGVETQSTAQYKDAAGRILGDFKIDIQQMPDHTYQATMDVHKPAS